MNETLRSRLLPALALLACGALTAAVAGCVIQTGTFPNSTTGGNNVANNGVNNGTNNGTNNGANNGINNSTNNGTNNGANNGSNNNGTNGYAFVLIEDLSEGDDASAAPGADIDAVCLLIDGEQHCATTVGDFNIGGAANMFIDTAGVIGPPDSECMAQNFTALGGNSAGSYIVLSFADEGFDGVFNSGDEVVVYELGQTLCPDLVDAVDEPTRVSVSASTDLATFVVIGETGVGRNVLQVP